MAATEDTARLGDGVLPRHQHIELTPDIEAGTFSGSTRIELELSAPTDAITLHAVDLGLTSVQLHHGGRPLHVREVTADEVTETVTLHLGEQAPEGPAALEIEYAGEFCDRLVGMYSSTFTVDGEEHELIVTQCESTHARRFVPCFDEPAFKATFSMTLLVPADLMAVSNAAEVSREPAGAGLDRVRFADTPPMSTYLLAVVVGPLEATEPRIVEGRGGDIGVRVVHPPGDPALCEFALDVAEAALLFFEDWYDLPYPGDKLDLVAVPDFAFGAMENLGCVTFREVLLLVDPSTATPQELQRVADVINHEIAHMWFGNLVTMKWWNGIWLNEAFATFMEVSASDAFRPEWDVWTTFGLARAAAFDTDALRSTRPIEFEVVTAAEAEAMFDILTYEKGCSVLRMLEQYLGPEVFRTGIRNYLRDNAFGNTETTDLWDALEAASGEPVRRIMDSWIFTGGHPLVSVEVREEDAASGRRTVARLEQTRALADPAAGAGGSGSAGRPGGGAGDAAESWPVPMRLSPVGSADADPQVVLLEDPQTVVMAEGATAVQPNAGGNGFYRSLLDTSSRRVLAHSGGTPLERFVLLDDTWFAMRSGHIDPTDALDTVTALVEAGEDDPSVWRRIAAACGDLVRLAGAAHGEMAAGWVRTTLGETWQHAAADPALTGRPAEVAGSLLLAMGNPGADPSALERARAFFADPTASPALGAGALDVVARHCDPREHEEIERRWRQAATPQEEQRHLSALVATADPALLERTLALLETDVRSQDAPYVFRRALANPTLGSMAWDHISANWQEMNTRFPSGSIPRMLEGIRGFTDARLVEEVAAFLTDATAEAGSRQVDQHIEAMRATAAAATRVHTGASQRPW